MYTVRQTSRVAGPEAQRRTRVAVSLL